VPTFVLSNANTIGFENKIGFSFIAGPYTIEEAGALLGMSYHHARRFFRGGCAPMLLRGCQIRCPRLTRITR
jgi:hypothetical protein